MNKRPNCFFIPGDWELWLSLAVRAGNRLVNFCRDCTPKYQAEMVAVGRCEYPQTQFCIIGGGVVGFRNGNMSENDEEDSDDGTEIASDD